MKLHPFRAVFPSKKLIDNSGEYLASIKEDFQLLNIQGEFLQEKEQAIYGYKITKGSDVYFGVIACTDIKDYIDEKILKHEETIEESEKSNLRRITGKKGFLSPVLLTHETNANLSNLLREVCTKDPLYEILYKPRGILHSIYRMPEPKMQDEILEIFNQEIPHVYIADGHHRCAALSKLFGKYGRQQGGYDYSKLFSALFSFDELKIYDYNRVIRLNSQKSADSLLQRLGHLFNMKPLDTPQKPVRKHHLTCYFLSKWYQLEWKEDILKKYKDESVLLDAHILNKEVMRPIFNILDVRHDERISYAEGTSDLDSFERQVDSEDIQVGFCLYPVQIHEIKAFADMGLCLPPKSTWFIPRMKSGVIMHLFRPL
jgi:uncharacterized protein (DUF1015 family)